MGFASSSGVRGSGRWRRAALLASTALVAYASPAIAVDATWNLNGTGDYNTAANWTPATVPDGTAIFGVSNQNAVSFANSTTVGGWTFNAGASAYTFTNGQNLEFSGAGIVINGGSAIITTLAGGTTTFRDTSTGGTARMIGGGTVNISALTSGGTSFGSIEGGGLFTLGANLLTVGSNNLSTTVSGVISGVGGALTKTGTGTLTLTGANTYTGGTTINAGTLQLGTGGSLASGSALTVNAGGTFDLNGRVQTVGSLAGSGTIALGGNFTAGTLTVASNNNLTFAGSIVGGGIFGETGVGLRKAGTGTLTLTGGNNYLRATHVEAGTLQAGAAGTFAFRSRVDVSAGATLDLNSFDQAITALTGSGNVTLGSATLTIGFGQPTGQGTFFSGTISGSGAVNLSGVNNVMPTFIFDGTNTYTGGTTIGTGTTLQLGIGGATGSIVGDVLNNGTLAFNRSGAVTFDGVISGTGAVRNSGGGTLTLTGANSYTGATALIQGGLIVNGSIASSSGLTLNGNTFVGGTGTLPSTTLNGNSTLSPGNSIGTITVQGNLTFGSGSLYLVEVSPTESDRTNVTGTANLAGTVAAVFMPGAYIQRNYTIISSAVRNGTFNTLAISGLPAGFTANLGYTGTEAQLILTAVLGNTPTIPSGELPQNQRSVATALNSFFNNGGTLPPAFVTLFGLTGQSLVNALAQVSGQAPTGAPTAATQMMNGFLSLMLNPYGGAPNNNPGAVGYARAFGAADRAPLPKEAADAFAAIMPGQAPPQTMFAQRWSVWGQSFGGYNRTDGSATAGTADTTARTYGFAAGADYRVTEQTTVGFALAGGELSWGLAQGLGGGKSDLFQAGVYASHRVGAAYVSATLAGAWYDTTTNRTITLVSNDTLRGTYDAQSVGGRIETGYRIATKHIGITPYGAAQVQNFRTPGYSETVVSGTNTFALTYGSRDVTASRFELGSWFDKLVHLNNGNAIMLRSRAAWAHDEGNGGGISAAFQTLPGAGFIVNGAAPPKDLALASAGGELQLRNGVSLGARFDGEFSGSAQTYAGTGTARYTW